MHWTNEPRGATGHGLTFVVCGYRKNEPLEATGRLHPIMTRFGAVFQGRVLPVVTIAREPFVDHLNRILRPACPLVSSPDPSAQDQKAEDEHTF